MRRPAVPFALIVAVLCCLALPGRVLADRQKAQLYYETGTNWFKKGQYDSAITSFQAAFHEEPLPDFLYNIGLSHKAAQRPHEALRFFEMYNLLVKDPAEKAQAAEQIEKMRAEAAQQTAQSPTQTRGAFDFSQANATQNRTTDSPPPRRWPIWLAVGAGVVAIAAVTTTAVLLTRPSDPPVLRVEKIP